MTRRLPNTAAASSAPIAAWALCGLFALPLLPAGAALAQPAPAAAPAEAATQGTLLRLAETVELRRAPDEITATLRVEARGGSAAAAQGQANAAMERALQAARTVSGLQATTGRYYAGRTEEGRQWQAVQTLTLRGNDPARLLELAGTLQGQGLAMEGIGWSLTEPQRREALAEAEREAIARLRARAETLAGQLGQSVAAIRELQVETEGRLPPRPMMAMAPSLASSRREAAPAAVPEELTLTATATATVLLQGR